MPGFIKTPADEKRWTEAKKAAGKQAKAGTPKYWRLANYIWHQMDRAAARMADDPDYDESPIDIQKGEDPSPSPTPSPTPSPDDDDLSPIDIQKGEHPSDDDKQMRSRMDSAKSGIDTRNRAGGPADAANVAKWLKDTETERMDAGGKGGYLITEPDGTKHLPTRKNGKVDHGLMGGAWAALHGGYRGNKYEGPGKQAAISKLKALYKREGMDTPDQKEAASALSRLARMLGLKTFAPEAPTTKPLVASAQTVSGTATCAVAIAFAEGDAGPAEWVELIPGGKFSAVDGRGPFLNEKPEKVVAASLARMPQVGLVLDYDHSTDLAAPEGRQSPAAGWIKGFKVGDKGAIFARVEWTKRARELLSDKEYRYISPVFEHDSDNKVECILRAALTNNPALIELPALASARSGMDKPNETEEMTTEKLAKVFPRKDGESLSAHLARLARHADAEETESAGALTDWAGEEEKEHGMDDDSEAAAGAYDEDMAMDKQGGGGSDLDPYKDETEEEMSRRQAEEMAKCANDEEQSACKMRHMAQRKRFEARKSQGLEVEAGKRGATEDKDESDDEAMRARMSRRPGVVTMTNKELQKIIDRAVARGIAQHPMMLSAQTTINQLRTERSKEDATAKVDKAIREGRLIPSQRSWAIEYCQANPKGFETFIGSQPKILQNGPDGTFTGRIGEPKPGPSSLTPSELNIFANLGLETEEQLAKCAAVKDKWTLRFPRPRLMLDDNATAQNNEK